ncbi:MAG: hypothetical protein E7012_02030 [Alphaproteobacteria bacterium]|nr:hypothetical protein [Alphaproteobacteria bacterium]
MQKHKKNKIEARMQIKRDFYLNQLIDRKQNKMIKIISVIRRCGKSYLLSELFTQHLLDNELQIRGYNVDVGEVNVENNKSTEIDFVANIGNKRYYIQSALSLPTSEKMMQEEKSLLSIRDGFKKIIITKSNLLQTYQDENGIIIMDLKEFLLNKNSLDT